MKYRAEALQISAWRAALSQMSQAKADVVPAGWHTPEELAPSLNFCEEMAKIKCRELVAAGLAERRDFKVAWGRMIRARPHYRLIAKTHKKH